MKILNLDKISIRFNDKWILRDCSLEIKQGEVFGILGVSGSGKTTLLQIIANNQKKYTGQIEHNFSNIFFLGKKEDSSWKSIFKSTKINISNGEKQRNQIEELLEKTNSESLLILDNAFCDIDQIWKDELFQQIRQAINEKQFTIIISTNLPEEVFVLCDRIGILDKGCFAQIDSPKELYEKPETSSTATLLGRNNLIEARRISFSNQQIPEFQTIIGEHRLQTGKAEKISLGTITNNVQLAIRPEHISLSFGASFPEDNLIKAKVAKIQYLGATTRVFLDANGLMLETLVLRLVGLNIGDECMVGIPPDRLIILKD